MPVETRSSVSGTSIVDLDAGEAPWNGPSPWSCSAADGSFPGQILRIQNFGFTLPNCKLFGVTAIQLTLSIDGEPDPLMMMFYPLDARIQLIPSGSPDGDDKGGTGSNGGVWDSEQDAVFGDTTSDLWGLTPTDAGDDGVGLSPSHFTGSSFGVDVKVTGEGIAYVTNSTISIAYDEYPDEPTPEPPPADADVHRFPQQIVDRFQNGNYPADLVDSLQRFTGLYSQVCSTTPTGSRHKAVSGLVQIIARMCDSGEPADVVDAMRLFAPVMRTICEDAPEGGRARETSVMSIVCNQMLCSNYPSDIIDSVRQFAANL